MKITKISPAVKTAGRYNIFVDGVYSFSLEETQLLASRLKTGAEISEDDLKELKNDSEFGKAYARALDLILRRPRSRYEILQYTKRKKWSEEISDKVIEKLENKNYINDMKFAEFWVQARKNSKPISQRKLRAELLQKRVDQKLIDETLLQYSDEDQNQALIKLINKKQKNYKDEQKLIAYLARQGFGYDDIKKAIAKESEKND